MMKSINSLAWAMSIGLLGLLLHGFLSPGDNRGSQPAGAIGPFYHLAADPADEAPAPNSGPTDDEAEAARSAARHAGMAEGIAGSCKVTLNKSTHEQLMQIAENALGKAEAGDLASAAQFSVENLIADRGVDACLAGAGLYGPAGDKVPGLLN